MYNLIKNKLIFFYFNKIRINSLCRKNTRLLNSWIFNKLRDLHFK
jgi:hypothetical protein